jgi:phage baseplate assembly protein W
VFEPMDATIQTLIKLTVRDAITVFEPRIKLLGVKLDNSMLVEGRIDIAIEYVIRATNSRFNLVYPFYITEANTKTA